LVVAAPDPYHGRQIIEIGRRLNERLDTVVRTHSAAAQAYFEGLGVGRAFMGERELALGMAHYALTSLGCSDDDADRAVEAIRAGSAGPTDEASAP
jgi:CPA2 family monovalent cation:H+ antiporter-2